MIIIVCLLLLVVTSCSTVSDVKQEIEPLTEIAVGEAMANRDSVMLGDYASSIDYVPLESHPEALLTTRDYETINGPGGEKVPAKKIYIFRDNMFSFLFDSGFFLLFNANGDPYSEYICHVFDFEGKYLSSINFEPAGKYTYPYVKANYADDGKLYVYIIKHTNIGKGSNESYCRIYDIISGNLLESDTVDSKNLRKLVPLDSDNIMLQYNSTDLETQENTMEGILVDSSFTEQKRIFAYKEDLTENVKLMKKKGHRAALAFTKSSIHKSDSGFVLLRELTDTLYKFTKKDNEFICKSLYKFNFADTLNPVKRKVRIDVETYLESEHSIFFQIEKNRDYKPTWSNSEIDEYKDLFYRIPTENTHNRNFGINESSTYIVYDKNTGVTRSTIVQDPVWMGGMTNDLDGGFPFWPEIVADGKMFQVVKAVDFIKLSKIYNSEKIKAIASKLTEDSNPVVVVATLK